MHLRIESDNSFVAKRDCFFLRAACMLVSGLYSTSGSALGAGRLHLKLVFLKLAVVQCVSQVEESLLDHGFHASIHSLLGLS
mmetsp:Transcript_17208/g.47409  ORF Transcript_17208/g.47409 Transcript_17208/m.47409 type:complete len:82 (+) Transcript_17208:201-446(+)